MSFLLSDRKLVIFDVDGTLIDSQNVIVEAQKRCFEAHGLMPPSRSAALSVVGLSLREAFIRLAGADGPIESLARGYKEAFNELRSNPGYEEPLYPGARETVERLANRKDVVLAIATGKSRRGVDRLFAKTGWRNLFASVQTADDHPSKPAPDMILAALQETGVDAKSSFMAGDTSYDMQMARSAGVVAIGVNWGYHARQDLEAAGAHMIVDDFGMLENTILHRTFPEAKND